MTSCRDGWGWQRANPAGYEAHHPPPTYHLGCPGWSPANAPGVAHLPWPRAEKQAEAALLPTPLIHPGEPHSQPPSQRHGAFGGAGGLIRALYAGGLRH